MAINTKNVGLKQQVDMLAGYYANKMLLFKIYLHQLAFYRTVEKKAQVFNYEIPDEKETDIDDYLLGSLYSDPKVYKTTLAELEKGTGIREILSTVFPDGKDAIEKHHVEKDTSFTAMKKYCFTMQELYRALRTYYKRRQAAIGGPFNMEEALREILHCDIYATAVLMKISEYITLQKSQMQVSKKSSDKKKGKRTKPAIKHKADIRGKVDEWGWKEVGPNRIKELTTESGLGERMVKEYLNEIEEESKKNGGPIIDGKWKDRRYVDRKSRKKDKK